MLTLFLENFVLIFVAIDPIGLLPIFATFTQGLSKKDITKLTIRSSVTAFVVLLTFWIFGSSLLGIMGISFESFRIIGGLFLLIIAYQMVFEQRQDKRQDTAKKAMTDEALSSLATFPLAIPFIAGPGSIAIVMLLSEKIDSDLQTQFIAFSPIFIVIALTALSLWLSAQLAKVLPMSALGVLQRTFGLLLGALAIEFVIEGIRNTFALV
jgi:multiple antibiotic resistance protein